MDGEQIAEREIVTPTVAALRLTASSRGAKHRRPYLFVIDEHDLHKLRQAGIPVSACIVFAVIQSAVKAAGQDWITLSPRATDALRHSFRWWWRQTELLEKAGFIEVERQRGRLPRYRLKTQAEAA